MGTSYGRGVSSTRTDRWLRLDGTTNTRDLGGLPTTDGGTTLPGRILRSDNLQTLSEADVRRLVDDVGLRQVVDLPQDWVETLLPRQETEHDAGESPAVRAYLGYLQHRGEAVVEALRALSDAGPGASLIHCAAGKD